MKFKISTIMKSTLKKTFKELEIPDKEFIGMKEGDSKLYTNQGDRMILTSYKGKKWVLFITGYASFEEIR
jgi:hypothetical protein